MLLASGLCLQVVCRMCSDYKAPLRYLMYKPDRVCTSCFEQLHKGMPTLHVSRSHSYFEGVILWCASIEGNFVEIIINFIFIWHGLLASSKRFT